MGKQPPSTFSSQHVNSTDCKDQDAPICTNDSCRDRKCPSAKNENVFKPKLSSSTIVRQEEANNKTASTKPVQELLIVGAGPHALTLLLRLLEPDPDFLTEKTRHIRAENIKQLRPIGQVHRHIQNISRGPAATLKPLKKRKSKRKQLGSEVEPQVPPPLPLGMVLNSTTIVDASGAWLAYWKQNFKAIGIPQLRSLISAHADPFDHRSLEIFAEDHDREEELITLRKLTQRDKEFRGPYQVPSTNLFHDFHDALIKSYGIQNVVQKGKVLGVTPLRDGDSDENIFEVEIQNGGDEITTVRTKRCVLAMGPIFNNCENSWEKNLRIVLGKDYDSVSKRIFRPDDIVQWLLRVNALEKEIGPTSSDRAKRRILIVGGGITSAQLALRAAKASWSKQVIFIQRSENLIRHFDVQNEWMGPRRGKVFDEFYSMDMNSRAEVLKSARKGGSIPPELVEDVQMQDNKNPKLICKEGVEISHVDWIDGEFHVEFDDLSMSPVTVDYIWLATGCQNIIERYPVLEKLCESLPIEIVNGLPVLSPDLSWASSQAIGEEECQWKQCARKRIWCMGALAGLQLGADALNIVGARHGAVKIANAIRIDMNCSDVNKSQS